MIGTRHEVMDRPHLLNHPLAAGRRSEELSHPSGESFSLPTEWNDRSRPPWSPIGVQCLSAARGFAMVSWHARETSVLPRTQYRNRSEGQGSDHVLDFYIAVILRPDRLESVLFVES